MNRMLICLVFGLALIGPAEAQKRTKYTVTVNVTSGGSVTSSNGGISCPSACSTSVNAGTSLTFTAAPDTGSLFTGWADGCAFAGNAQTCSITVNANSIVSASFETDGGGGGGGGGGGSPPTITEVYFDTVSSPATLTAVGTNLDAITTASLGASPLTPQGSTATGYTALLPDILPDGDYLLTLTNAAGSATWQLTYPAVGPEGPPGQPGADGAPGAPGADGLPGAPGADGADGAPGTSCSATQHEGGALISCGDGSTATVSNGQDGAKGDKGDPGPQGDQGPVGPEGPQGPSGEPASNLAIVSESTGKLIAEYLYTRQGDMPFYIGRRLVNGVYAYAALDSSFGLNPSTSNTYANSGVRFYFPGSSGGCNATDTIRTLGAIQRIASIRYRLIAIGTDLFSADLNSSVPSQVCRPYYYKDSGTQYCGFVPYDPGNPTCYSVDVYDISLVESDVFSPVTSANRGMFALPESP